MRHILTYIELISRERGCDDQNETEQIPLYGRSAVVPLLALCKLL